MSEEPTTQPDADRTTEIAEKTDAAKRRAWYQKKRFLLPIVAVLAFLLGTGAGAGGERDASPQQAADLRDLEDEVESLEGQVADLEEERDELEEERDELEAQQEQDEELSQQVTDLEEEAASLQEDVTALREHRDALAAQSQQRAERIRDLESQLAAAQQQAAPAPAPQPTAPAPAPQPRPSQPGSGSSTSYENCDAARAAGAAPLRRGDPGYASHLDRDNDGVACE